MGVRIVIIPLQSEAGSCRVTLKVFIGRCASWFSVFRVGPFVRA